MSLYLAYFRSQWFNWCGQGCTVCWCLRTREARRSSNHIMKDQIRSASYQSSIRKKQSFTWFFWLLCVSSGGLMTWALMTWAACSVAALCCGPACCSAVFWPVPWPAHASVTGVSRWHDGSESFLGRKVTAVKLNLLCIGFVYPVHPPLPNTTPNNRASERLIFGPSKMIWNFVAVAHVSHRRALSDLPFFCLLPPLLLISSDKQA